MLGPFATASRLTPIHQVSLAVLSRAACASMSTTTTTTTTTRDRGDRYGPMEWAQLTRLNEFICILLALVASAHHCSPLLQCQNGGTLDVSVCKCYCTDGFHGRVCEVGKFDARHATL